jgi:hypothetical protein
MVSPIVFSASGRKNYKASTQKTTPLFQNNFCFLVFDNFTQGQQLLKMLQLFKNV